MANEFKIKSSKQKGGITAGTVNITLGNSHPEDEPGSKSTRPKSPTVIKWIIAIVGGIASLIAIFTYFGIGPSKIDLKKTSDSIALKKTLKNNEFDSVQTLSIKKNKTKISMEENTKKGGDTYNVESHNQSGGITAGKVEMHNPTINVDEDINAFDINDNWTFKIDTLKKEVRIWPKKGKWKNPIIAYPADEQNFVNGRFSCASNVFIGNSAEGHIDIENKRHAFFETVQPITKENYFTFQYDSKPSVIRFGQNRLFYATIKLN